MKFIEQYGQKVVYFYMDVVQVNVEFVVRQFLKEIRVKYEGGVFRFVGIMDNSFCIYFEICIREDGSVIFDFIGMIFELYGNMNVFKVLIFLGIIFCICVMIGIDIFLNQGCFFLIDVILLEGCFFNFFDEVVVCVGNINIFQCICDIVLEVF